MLASCWTNVKQLSRIIDGDHLAHDELDRLDILAGQGVALAVAQAVVAQTSASSYNSR